MATTAVSLYKLVKSEYPDETLILNHLKSTNYSFKVKKSVVPKIRRHFAQTISHRHWLYNAFTLIRDSLKPHEQVELHRRILSHDLSKFSVIEAKGYALKFGGKKNAELTSGRDVAAWIAALEHHYKVSDHHPQHNVGQDMPHYARLESVVDMLGCRLQRNLSGQPNVTPSDIFNVPAVFLDRYTTVDKKLVTCHLKRWSNDVLTTPHRRALALRLLQ